MEFLVVLAAILVIICLKRIDERMGKTVKLLRSIDEQMRGARAEGVEQSPADETPGV